VRWEESTVRTIGIILAILGALALGYESFRAEPAKGNAAATQRRIWIPPVVAGITLVTGLLLTAAAYRHKEE
jgi:hypothetical protein